MKQLLKSGVLVLLLLVDMLDANGQSFNSIATTAQTISFANAANYLTTSSTTQNTLSFLNLARDITYEVRVTLSGNFTNGANSIAATNLRLNATQSIGNLSANSSFASNALLPASGYLVVGNWTRSGGSNNYDPVINFTLNYPGANALVPGNTGSTRIYGPVTLSFALFRISGTTATAVGSARTMTVNIGIQNVIEVTLNTATTTLNINTPAQLRNGSNLALPGQVSVLSNQPFSLRAYATAVNLSNTATQTFAANNISLQVPTSGIGANASFQTLSSSSAAPTILTTASPAGINTIIDLNYRINPGPNILKPAGTYTGNLVFLATQ